MWDVSKEIAFEQFDDDFFASKGDLKHLKYFTRIETCSCFH